MNVYLAYSNEIKQFTLIKILSLGVVSGIQIRILAPRTGLCLVVSVGFFGVFFY